MKRDSAPALASDDHAKPYRSTPIFDQDTLPGALRSRHNTKAGVWGVIKVIEGELRLTYLDPPADRTLKAGERGIVQPQQWHFVTPLGSVKMRVDFFDQSPVASFPL